MNVWMNVFPKKNLFSQHKVLETVEQVPFFDSKDGNLRSAFYKSYPTNPTKVFGFFNYIESPLSTLTQTKNNVTYEFMENLWRCRE